MIARNIIVLISISLLFIGIAYAGNITVYESDSSYIIWKINSNLSHAYIDGCYTEFGGEYFGQYDLSPNTLHFACEENETCIGARTEINGEYVFFYWLVYIILVVLCIVSFYIPITIAPVLIYGLYLIRYYLPGIGAEFSEYVLTSALMIMGMVATISGLRKNK